MREKEVDIFGKNYYGINDLINELSIGAKEIDNVYADKSIKISFEKLCLEVRNYFDQIDLSPNDLERQKRAIIGHTEEVEYYKDVINTFLKKNLYFNCDFPEYYSSLSSALYHELWGLAGIAEWYEGKTEKLKNSYSAHIIGEDIFFLIDGKMELMPQKMSASRKHQLKRALLSNDYRVRMDNDVPDIEMVTGERIKIFSENVTRKGKETIIFRKFPVINYTFEKQIELRTYPDGSLEFFKLFAELGYNIVFTGGVGSTKTTQLATWLSYEDRSLCGLVIETRPELPLDIILPDAPVVSLVVDSEDKLMEIRPSIMRSDADYVIMAEARDAYAYDIALKSANIGSRRCKMTAHINSPVDFPHEFASEISRVFGGNIDDIAIRIAKSYDINIHFVSLPHNKNKKRLDGIYVFDYDEEKYSIRVFKICSYNYENDSWSFNNRLSKKMRDIGENQERELFTKFKEELLKLSVEYPMSDEDKKEIIPFYSRR